MKHGGFLGQLRINYLLKEDPPLSYSKLCACLRVELTQTLTWAFIHLSLVSSFRLILFGLLLLFIFIWSPPFICLCLASFYLLVFGLLPVSTCLWCPFIHLALVSSFYLLLFDLLLSTYFRSPLFNYLSLVSSIYLLSLVSFYLLVFRLLPLSTCVWSPFI